MSYTHITSTLASVRVDLYKFDCMFCGYEFEVDCKNKDFITPNLFNIEGGSASTPYSAVGTICPKCGNFNSFEKPRPRTFYI